MTVNEYALSFALAYTLSQFKRRAKLRLRELRTKENVQALVMYLTVVPAVLLWLSFIVLYVTV